MAEGFLDRAAELKQKLRDLHVRSESLKDRDSENWTTYRLAGEEALDLADTATRKAWAVIDRLIQLADAELAQEIGNG